MADLYADIFEIHDFGATIASPSRRVVATNFIDKVLFAHPDSPLLFWTGAGSAQQVPGLPPNEYYRGVNVFQGHIVLWTGNRLKWSSPNDFTEWIPVGETAASFVFTLAVAFVRGANGVEGEYMYVNESPLGLVSGQFVRIDSDPNYDFFEVATVLPVTELIGNVAGFSQSIAAGATQPLFLNGFIPYKTGARLYFEASQATLEVVEDAIAVPAGTYVVATAFIVPAPGATVEVEVTAQPQINAGSYVSVGPAFYTGQDIYFVEAVNLADNKMTLRRTGVALAGSLDHQPGEFVIPQPYVRVKNISVVTASGGFLTKLLERFGFTVKPMDLSGQSSPSKEYPISTEVFTVDANGAGETVNAGSSVNGEILHFDTLSDYGFIYKRRSIQSVQYTGPDQGTFFIRPEISDEGFLGDYAFVKVGEDVLYFFGHKEIYKHVGGNQLIPIGQQFTKQIFAEVDRAKANQIFAFHNEKDSEVWFVYPQKDTTGPLRAFVYNYLENSCTLDDYPTALEALTAAGRLDWSNDIIWIRSTGSWIAPGDWDADATWDDLGADVNESFNIIGARTEPIAAVPSLLVHGEDTFNRLGEPYNSSWESIDFDAGDPLAFKYVDTIVLSLQVKVKLDSPAPLNIYVGTKNDFDDDISWSAPRSIRVEGNGNITTKVNIRKSGKFFRLKILSDAADIQWRISQIRILGRKGGTY